MPELDHVEGRGLVKMFGTTRALGPIDVRFERGTVTAVEGANGSGKSTLLGLLSLSFRPTRGSLVFGSLESGDAQRLRKALGLVGHAPMLYPDLNAEENLRFYASLYDLTDPDRRIAAMRERFELRSWSTRPARTYSRGQLQRVALARALIHDPQLILLDEPSTGLDAGSLERLITAVEDEKARGATLVLVTHDEHLAARVSDRRLRLAQGRIEAT